LPITGEPDPASPVEVAGSVPDGALILAVQGLDHNDMVHLLTWLATTVPEVATAGLGAVENWHDDARRKRNRRSTLNAREKRREGRRNGLA
jgi:hypothetical protein